MLNKLRKLVGALGDTPEQTPFAAEALAVAALMIEACHMDGAFDDTERATVHRLLKGAFGLNDPEVATLIATAEQAQARANQLVHFTRAVKDHVPVEERTEIMELLWEVVLADGDVHDYEANLMRRIAGLIHVTDRESGKARKRAEAKFALARDGQEPLED
ncbi:MAG: TerB family tellurite resistance protein [Alphaproteobacteria bacterium]|nr:MAG: TerB family tellurite resistance protein [Alphaproteobacteria bacterium]